MTELSCSHVYYSMKAIIWIIILAVVAWGIWYFMKDNNAPVGVYGNTSGQVEGASDAYNADGSDAGGSAQLNGSAEVDVKG